MRIALVISALLAVGLVACANSGGPPQYKSPVTTNKARKNVTVQFSDGMLHPSVARVLPGGNVVWVNYTAGDLVGAVVFPASIKDSFTCTSLRPLFSKVAAGYQSLPITGAGGEDVTLPCPLKPGTYDYQINLGGGGDGMGGASVDNPQVTLPGKIVVE